MYVHEEACPPFSGKLLLFKSALSLKPRSHFPGSRPRMSPGSSGLFSHPGVCSQLPGMSPGLLARIFLANPDDPRTGPDETRTGPDETRTELDETRTSRTSPVQSRFIPDELRWRRTNTGPPPPPSFGHIYWEHVQELPYGFSIAATACRPGRREH